MTALSIGAMQLLPPSGTYTVTPTSIGSINYSFECSSKEKKKSNIRIGSINSWFESSRKEKKKKHMYSKLVAIPDVKVQGRKYIK